MITFHPEVHLSHFEEQKELLKTRALQNEIILLLECKQYNASSENSAIVRISFAQHCADSLTADSCDAK